jgi:transposase
MLNRQRTQISNALRSHLSEFGVVAPIGRNGIEQLLSVINDENDARIPADARLCLRMLEAQLRVVKQQILGGKERLGSISKAGNRYLRQLLVVGAMAVIRYAERNGTRRPWLVQLMARRTTKVAAVALANKTARMVWALMTGGERYREPIIA